MSFENQQGLNRWVKIWMMVGIAIIIIQILIGGVTRLTGSGLSITRWEVVRGTIPPLNAAQWDAEFELYKATPQYQKINEGMSLDAFKFIYFWEYFHRLWARLMFFVFLFPFFWFLNKGYLSKQIIRRLIVVVLLAGFEGFIGWIMVKSGLRSRPWVNAYNLTLHLTMALIIYSYLLWTAFVGIFPNRLGLSQGFKWGLLNLNWGILVLCFVQLALGAMMSGTKAGLLYPTWPDMKGVYMPDIIFNAEYWNVNSFIQYDSNPFLPTLIQFLHRNTAYLLTILIGVLTWRIWKDKSLWVGFKQHLLLLWGVLALQITLGIFTVLQCKGSIPVFLGVVHQVCAVILLSVILWVLYLGNKQSGELK